MTEERLRSMFHEAICAKTAVTETRQLSGRASGKVALCIVRGHNC